MSTGQSPASHEGTDALEPHAKDDEVLTMTRGDLRIVVDGVLDVALPRLYAHVHREIDKRAALLTIDFERRANDIREQVAALVNKTLDTDYVRVETVEPQDIAR